MQPPNIDPQTYTVLRELGRGTTGVVYQARGVHFDRIVALKVPQFGNDPNRKMQWRRFMGECRILASIHDSGIPALYAVGDEYQVREFIDGTTLEHCTAAGAISLRDAVACLETVCCTVGRVHASGITHRNLHPANILIARDGTPKLIGFGRWGSLPSSAADAIKAAGIDVCGIQGVLNWVCTVLQQRIPPGVDAAQQPGAAASADELADLLAQCVQDWDAG